VTGKREEQGMRVRIQSDGYPASTRVYNVDTGEQVEGITSVRWSLDADGFATVELTLYGVPVDVQGEAAES
jgi:hypothetical protein